MSSASQFIKHLKALHLPTPKAEHTLENTSALYALVESFSLAYDVEPPKVFFCSWNIEQGQTKKIEFQFRDQSILIIEHGKMTVYANQATLELSEQR